MVKHDKARSKSLRFGLEQYGLDRKDENRNRNRKPELEWTGTGRTGHPIHHGSQWTGPNRNRKIQFLTKKYTQNLVFDQKIKYSLKKFSFFKVWENKNFAHPTEFKDSDQKIYPKSRFWPKNQKSIEKNHSFVKVREKKLRAPNRI